MQQLMKKRELQKHLTGISDQAARIQRSVIVSGIHLACGHGANKQNTVYQAGKNVDRGYSQKDAKSSVNDQ